MGGAATQTELGERLRERRGELEQAALARVRSVSDPREVSDPSYREGLRAAVSAAVDYGLSALGSSERNPPEVPPLLLSQARLAARNRVDLETVLRRYFAGYALLGDFLVEEAQAAGGTLREAPLKRMLRTQASLFDRLIASVSQEYRTEERRRLVSGQRRRLELIQRLLDGEPLETDELAYGFDATHLAIVAAGPGLPELFAELARELDRRLLIVCPEERSAWVWLGARHGVDREEVTRLLRSSLPPGAALAFGEPAEGLAGWRLSHRQAKAALPIAQRGPQRSVRYADVALLATVIQDELLSTSLRRLYLEPLEREPDGGELARETLGAYFAAECNVSSTAAALGVNRKTVAARLRGIETAIGEPLASRVTEIGAALSLGQLVPTSSNKRSP